MKHIRVLAILSFWYCCVFSASAMIRQETNGTEDKTNLFKNLEVFFAVNSISEKLKEDYILAIQEILFYHDSDLEKLKWNTFLESRTKFNNEEYLFAIKNTYEDYKKAYLNLNICIKLLDSKESKYSSRWLKDVEVKFGKQYITKNYNMIKMILLQIWHKFDSEYCSDAEKEFLYKEIIFREINLDYLQYYLKYIESLDQKSKKRMEKRIQLNKTLIDIFAKSSAKDILKQRLILNQLHLSTQSKFDKELFKFLNTHSDLIHSFDIIAAVEDLERYKK